jgi:general stress protein CsbA
MSLARVIVFSTTFGGSYFLTLFQQTHNYYLLFVGAVCLVAGFAYLSRISKKAKAVVEAE